MGKIEDETPSRSGLPCLLRPPVWYISFYYFLFWNTFGAPPPPPPPPGVCPDPPLPPRPPDGCVNINNNLRKEIIIKKNKDGNEEK